MTVCGGKAQYDHGSYVKKVKLKVKTLMEGGPSQVISGRPWHNKFLTIFM